MENRQVFFLTRMLFWGLGLSLILNVAGTSFWISEILGALIGISIILLVKKTNTSKIVKSLSGFIIAFLAAILLANLGGTMFLRNTPNWFLSLVPILGGVIVSKSRDDSTKKTLLILFSYSIIIHIFGRIVLMPYIKSDNLLPFIPELSSILKGAGIFIVTSITPPLALGDIKDKKTFVMNYLLGIATVILTSLLVILVLGNKEALLYRYPEYIVLKRIKIFDFFSNVENLFVIPMIVDTVITICYGFRNIKLFNNFGKVFFPILMWILAIFACSSGAIMTLIYSIFPYILLGILILTLFPKK